MTCRPMYVFAENKYYGHDYFEIFLEEKHGKEAINELWKIQHYQNY